MEYLKKELGFRIIISSLLPTLSQDLGLLSLSFFGNEKVERQEIRLTQLEDWRKISAG
jgi:hypothetical protein